MDTNTTSDRKTRQLNKSGVPWFKLLVLLVVTVVVMACIPVIAIVVFRYLLHSTSEVQTVISIAMALAFSAVAILSYLEADATRRSRRYYIFKSVSTVSRVVHSILGISSPPRGLLVPNSVLAFHRQQLAQAREYNAVEQRINEDRHKLASEIREKISQAAPAELAAAGMLASLERIEEQAAEARRIKSLDKQFSESRARLESAIDLLHKKANINMVVGIILSVIGIFFLGITVVPGLSTFFGLTLTSEASSTLSEFWMRYIPRFALAFVLELFAYFFLNLYKANAAETRYYHNEMTNLSARHSAAAIATSPRDSELVKLVLADLLKTERNGILTKSQTTIEIARAKAEAESSRDAISAITKLSESITNLAHGRSGKRADEG